MDASFPDPDVIIQKVVADVSGVSVPSPEEQNIEIDQPSDSPLPTTPLALSMVPFEPSEPSSSNMKREVLTIADPISSVAFNQAVDVFATEVDAPPLLTGKASLSTKVALKDRMLSPTGSNGFESDNDEPDKQQLALDKLGLMDKSITALNRKQFNLREIVLYLKSYFSKELSAVEYRLSLHQDKHNTSHVNMYSELSVQMTRLQSHIDQRMDAQGASYMKSWNSLFMVMSKGGKGKAEATSTIGRGSEKKTC